MALDREWILLAVVQLTLVVVSLRSCEASSVTLDDHGYKGVVVAFSSDIDESVREKVLLETEKLLTETSSALYAATRQSFFIEGVTFLIPSTWGSSDQWSSGSLTVEVARLEKYGDSDIFIDANGGVFGDNPFTLQHAGCGQQGLRIRVPYNFLLKTDLVGERAKQLVHEWAHYRYGVFDEGGFPGDPLYPLYTSIPGSTDGANYRVTDCANVPIIYSDVDESGRQCPISGALTTGGKACYPVPETTGNEGVKSSLMFQPIVSQVNDFCDDDELPHDSRTLNKHNAMCGRQSVWTVISRSKDFVQASSEVTKRPVVFRYVQETTFRLVLAVDSTDIMDTGYRFNFVKSAFVQFLKDVPSGSKVGLVSYAAGPSDSITVNLTSDLETVMQNFPVTYTSGPTCVRCAIDRALQVLRDDDTPNSGGSIVLVTREDITKEDADQLKVDFGDAEVRLYVVYYSETPPSTSALRHLVAATTGEFHFIPLEVRSEDRLITVQTLLHGAFSSLVRGYSWEPKNNLVVLQGEVDRSDGNATVAFDIDPGITNIEITLSGQELTAKEGITDLTFYLDGEALPDSALRHDYIQAYKFSPHDAAVGFWEVKFRVDDNYQFPVTVMVTGSQAPNTSAVISSCWINSNDRVVNASAGPVLIYSEIVRGGLHPVINASVTATVHSPDLQVTILDLVDNGLGDPDVTRNDGIYSRYFTNFTAPGQYLVTVSIDGNIDSTAAITGQPTDEAKIGRHCCGSLIPTDGIEPLGSFTRVVSCGSFEITDLPGEDIYPPGQILDLRVIEVDSIPGVTGTYTLRWTAPGNDFDFGKAAHYELKLFDGPEDALRNFETAGRVITEWDRHGKIGLDPEPYGSVETAIVQMPRNATRDTHAFAIRAVDGQGNKGEVSNVVEVFYEERSFTTTDSQQEGNTTSATEAPPTGEDSGQRDSHIFWVTVIVGGVVGVVVLVVIVILAIVFCTRRQQRDASSATCCCSCRNLSSKERDEDIFVNSELWPKSKPRSPTTPSEEVSNSFKFRSVRELLKQYGMENIDKQTLDVTPYTDEPPSRVSDPESNGLHSHLSPTDSLDDDRLRFHRPRTPEQSTFFHGRHLNTAV